MFTTREHIIALEARDNGMVGVTFRYPYEVRQAQDYFDVIEDEKVPKDMLDLAVHIVESKKGRFEPGNLRTSTRTRSRSYCARSKRASASSDRRSRPAPMWSI